MTSFILIFLFCFLLIVSSSLAKTSPRPILQVTKDAKTLQYVTQVLQRTPLVPVKLTLDLGGDFTWVNCETDYISSTFHQPVCGSPQCQLLNITDCVTECFDEPRIKCAINTCRTFPSNNIARSSSYGQISGDVFAIHLTDGKNILPVVTIPNIYFISSDDFLNVGLASGVTGMAGLGRTKMSLPAQLSSYFKFNTKFALCLSSSTRSSGAVFFGDGPYTLLPNLDVSSFLTYTPLIINSIIGLEFPGGVSPQYFIGVKSIKINEKRVSGFNESLLSFNDQGVGGTIISTTDPYTALETSIYNAVVAAFVEAMPKNVERVPKVAPFGACFSSKNIGSTRLGPAVPSIDLVLQSKNILRIYGANSMVEVNKNILCLGFKQIEYSSPNIPVCWKSSTTPKKK